MVSAVTMVTVLGSTSSSSAAHWIRAVLMPWPSSALPVKTVTVPLPSIPIQASRYGALSRLPGSLGCACAAGVAQHVKQRGARIGGNLVLFAVDGENGHGASIAGVGLRRASASVAAMFG